MSRHIDRMTGTIVLLGVLGLGTGLGFGCGGPPQPKKVCKKCPKLPETKGKGESEEVSAPSLPDYGAIPEGPFGDAVRRGEKIFTQTTVYAADYAGTSHNCVNCHLDAGRRADSAPLWAAWGMYPAYRKKNDRINSMEDRLRGCFTYSMNASASKAGQAPPLGDPILKDLQAYMYWMASDAPTGRELPGRGFPKLAEPASPPDPEAGAQVYTDNCAICHGAEGQGLRVEDAHQQFPPLWGSNAYNWGAGMHRINTAAGFIKANMPLGKGNSLTDKQAWDVAAYINSHERPRDPRQEGSLAGADAAFHGHPCMYGEAGKDGGQILGVGLAAAAE